MALARFFSKPILLSVTVLGIILSFLGYFNPISLPMMTFDMMSISFGFLALLVTLIGFLIYVGSQDVLVSEWVHPVALLIFATAGAMVMISWSHLLILFLGIEILSIPFYALAASHVTNARSQESGIKYFLMGAVASAIFLFGMALYFAGTGLFVLDPMVVAAQVYTGDLVSLSGIFMMMAGLAFKAGFVPFHAWVADVYEGAPTVFVGWMAALVKVAIFATFLRFLMPLFPIFQSWGAFLGLCCIFTMFLGNGLALFQTSLKRLFAYSGIAHAGYLCLALLPATPVSVPTILVYVCAYLLSILGVMWVILLLEKQGLSDDFSSLNGLWRRSPFVFSILMLSVFSMAGIPPLAGFFAKLGLVLHPMENGFMILSLMAFINFFIGIAYYGRVLLAAATSKLELSPILPSRLMFFSGILILLFQVLISIASLYIL